MTDDSTLKNLRRDMILFDNQVKKASDELLVYMIEKLHDEMYVRSVQDRSIE